MNYKSINPTGSDAFCFLYHKNSEFNIYSWVFPTVFFRLSTMETTDKNIERKVKNNDTVAVHYTGKLSNGQIFDSSVDKEPLEFQMGQGQIIPGFEKGLMNMSISEKKSVTIPEAEAYGEVREDLFQEVPKADLPPEIDPQVGMGLVAKNPDGSERQLRVAEVRNESILIDANHPLAGQDLTFDLEVVAIK